MLGPEIDAEVPAATRRPPATLRGDAGVEAAPTGHVAEVDAMRGVACLAIMAFHFAPLRFPGGWAAVDFFFVLSGYLITGIILEHGRGFSLRNFYIRRGLRIWPIYYLTVLGVAAAAAYLPRPVDFSALPYLLGYVQNVPFYWSHAAPRFNAYLDHTWSLALEEQFYLIWPPLAWAVGRRGLPALALATAASSVWARARGYHWWLLLARCDGLALGGLLAAWRPIRGRRAAASRTLDPALVAVGLASLAYLAMLGASGGMSSFGPPRWPALTLLAVNLAGFAAIGLVVGHAGHPRLWPLRDRRLARIGVISYGLYMYHYVVILLVEDLAVRLGFGGRPFWRDVLTAALIFAAAGLSWRFVERPVLALKGRFPYRPASRRHAPASAPRDTGTAARSIAG